MNEKWNRVPLSEIAEFQNGYSFSSRDYVEKSIHNKEVLRMGYIKRGGGFKEFDKPVFIPPNHKGNEEKYSLENGDIVIAMTDMKDKVAILGNCARITEAGRFLLNQRVGRIRTKDENKANQKFLYYFLNSPNHIQNLRSRANSGVQVNLTTASIIESSISLPSIFEQNRISTILGVLDEKIELNQQKNKTLEIITSSLFKSWFIDFDPVKAKLEGNSTKLSDNLIDLFPDSFTGEVPTGWGHIDLGTLSSVIDPHPSHRAPKSFKEGFPFAGIGDIDEMGNIKLSKARIVDESSVLQQEKSYNINENSIGFGRVGTVGKVVRLRKQNYRFALSPTLAVINPINEEFSSICHCLVRSNNFQNKVFSEMTGSTRPAIGIQVLRKIKSILPNIDNLGLYKEFEKIISPLIKRSDLINKEINILEEMRDALLPKLISGELRIPDAEKIIEGVRI